MAPMEREDAVIIEEIWHSDIVMGRAAIGSMEVNPGEPGEPSSRGHHCSAAMIKHVPSRGSPTHKQHIQTI